MIANALADGCSEPALQNANGLTTSGTSKTGYTVTVTSKGNDATTFSITNANGVVTRTCGPAANKGKGGCPSSGTW